MSTLEPTMRPATSADVARLAGVSRSTVSNILNGNDARFTQATRDRVHAAAQELAYQPSVAGRSLVSGRSDTIVILVSNAGFAAHFQDAVDRVMRNTRQIGGNVVIRLAGEDVQATTESVAMLRPLAVVDFGVLSDEERDYLERSGTIIVPTRSETTRYSAHGQDPAYYHDGGISALQLSALLEHKPEQIIYAAFTDYQRDPYIPGRLTAITRICAKHGLPEPQLISVDLDLDSGIQALKPLLATGKTLGIACYNDDVALTLLAAARELGVKVPEQLAITGVDNSPLGQMWSPRLTTIDTDLQGLVDAVAIELRIRLGEKDLELPASYGVFSLVRGESA